MTPEAQRIAIAEAWWTPTPDGWWTKDPAGIKGPRFTDIPDYLNDLNAMHEAITSLPAEQIRRYRFHLRAMCGTYEEAIDATAAERAEAFLRTLNLWTE